MKWNGTEMNSTAQDDQGWPDYVRRWKLQQGQLCLGFEKTSRVAIQSQAMVNHF